MQTGSCVKCPCGSPRLDGGGLSSREAEESPLGLKRLTNVRDRVVEGAGLKVRFLRT